SYPRAVEVGARIRVGDRTLQGRGQKDDRYFEASRPAQKFFEFPLHVGVHRVGFVDDHRLSRESEETDRVEAAGEHTHEALVEGTDAPGREDAAQVTCEPLGG